MSYFPPNCSVRDALPIVIASGSNLRLTLESDQDEYRDVVALPHLWRKLSYPPSTLS